MIETNKDFYDYFIAILPIITAIIAWIASAHQNMISNNRLLLKEQYFKNKESMKDIILLFNTFSQSVYDFHKESISYFNDKKVLPTVILNDFITDYNMKLAYIYQLVKIEKPFYRVPVEEITMILNDLERQVIGINGLISRLILSEKSQLSEIDASIISFNDACYEIMGKLSDKIARIENILVANLMKESINIGLSTKKEKKEYNDAIRKLKKSVEQANEH